MEQPAAANDEFVVRNLSVCYPTGVGMHKALDRVSFSLPKQASLCLLGSSSAGKSTLLAACLGTLPSNAVRRGLVSLPGLSSSADRRGEGKYLRNHVAWIVQNPGECFLSGLSVGEQARTLIHLRLGLGGKELEATLDKRLESVGLNEIERIKLAKPNELSGGMLQRVAIAIAMATGSACKLIVADEPMASLDTINAARILSLILNLQRASRCTLVMVTHDSRLLQHFSHVGVLDQGQLVEWGASSEFAIRQTSPAGQELMRASRMLNSEISQVP